MTTELSKRQVIPVLQVSLCNRIEYCREQQRFAERHNAKGATKYWTEQLNEASEVYWLITNATKVEVTP